MVINIYSYSILNIGSCTIKAIDEANDFEYNSGNLLTLRITDIVFDSQF